MGKKWQDITGIDCSRFGGLIKSILNKYTQRRCLYCGHEQDHLSSIRLHSHCIQPFLTQMSVDLLDMSPVGNNSLGSSLLWHDTVSTRIQRDNLSLLNMGEVVHSTIYHMSDELKRHLPVGFQPLSVTIHSDEEVGLFSKMISATVTGNPMCFYCQSQGRDAQTEYSLIKTLPSLMWENEDSILPQTPRFQTINPSLNLFRVGQIYVHSECLKLYLKELEEYDTSRRISHP